jgi:hypothetical protein
MDEVVRSVDETDEYVEMQNVGMKGQRWSHGLSCPDPDPCFYWSRIVLGLVLGRVHVRAPRIRDDHLFLV